MAWWIQLYLLLFAVLLIAGLWDDYRRGCSLWGLLAGGFSSLIIVHLFVSYWRAPWLPDLALLNEVLFIAALAWQLHEVRDDLKYAAEDPDLTRSTLIAGVVISTLFCLPAYIIAGIVAFQG